MLFWMIVKSALSSLLANKLRSILAMLGIIIGVGAVIAMLAIGAGARKQVLDRFSAMGTNVLVIRPGQRGTGGVMSGTQQNLTVDDAATLVRDVPGIQQITPVVNGNAQVKYFGRNSRTSVQGVGTTWAAMRNYEVERGRFLTEREAEGHARVAVVGPTTVENLMSPDIDPVGQQVKVNGVNFRVIGVFKAKGDQGFFNPDDQIVIPYTTAMKQVFGLDYLREVDIEMADQDQAETMISAATEVLRRRHRLQPGAPDDFTVRNQADIVNAASEATNTFNWLLGSVATISLLVGGIGIMNIMLVTVTERTREIGVRKAIGAKDRDIMRQFLIEAVLMSGLGGVLGVLGGIATAVIIGRLTQFVTIIQPASVLLALSFAAAVGIFFGFYPARRAALLDPIEALRYE
jgi:putative ABC transport system permease protein